VATKVHTERTVGGVIESGAEAWGDKVAIDFGEASYSYSDLWSRGRRAAQLFIDQGVKRGDPVLVMLDNTIEFVDVWLGLALMGAIQVPVNTEYLGGILRHQITDSEAWLMVVDERYLGRIAGLGADHGLLRRLLVSGSGECPAGLECESWDRVCRIGGDATSIDRRGRAA
jgi:crotonobetaine/carnitine-CoA ligase